jgi:hypothetical protein
VNLEEMIDVFSDTKRYGNSAILTNITISYDLNSKIKYAILDFESDESKNSKTKRDSIVSLFIIIYLSPTNRYT